MAYAHVSPHYKRPSPDELDKLFGGSAEERKIRVALKEEITTNPRICLEQMNRLVLANHTGEKMDVVKDMAGRAPRYGGRLTEAQHKYAASIITKHHLDTVLELLAKEAAGEDTVEEMTHEDGSNEIEIRRVPRARPAAPVIDESATDNNPMLGMF